MFGSFQLKQSQSYLSDLIENGKAYIIEEPSLKIRKQKKDVSKCKTIGLEITSRHKRSEIKQELRKVNSKRFRTIYKVFLKYLPYENNSKAIKGIILYFY